jgi:uncharacterized membrane protein
MHCIQTLADGLIPALKAFVTSQKLHPVLVNFTAALVPVSVGMDVAARILKKESLRATAWWTLFVAACITPFTAIAGWLFWMDDDNGVAAMNIHKWLGTSLAVLLVGLVLWRWRAFRKDRWPSVPYLIVGAIVVGALVYQGRLGGDQSFGAMTGDSGKSSAVTATESTSINGMKGMSMNTPNVPSTAPVRAPDTTPATAPTSAPAMHWQDHIDVKEVPNGH